MTQALRIVCGGGLLIAVASGAAWSQQQGDVATFIFATYKCKPADRSALRSFLEGPGVTQFQDWKKKGVLTDYLLFFSSFVNDDAWDLMTVVSFDKYTKSAAWEAIEQDLPGGLPREAQRLAQPVDEYLADLTWEGNSARMPAARSKAVYLIMPQEYEPLVSRATYQLYMRSHELPVLDGLLKEGALAAYRIYLNHHHPGKPWDALHVLEFPDLERVAQRGQAEAKVKATLAGDDHWKVFLTRREHYALNSPGVIADAIVAK